MCKIRRRKKGICQIQDECNTKWPDTPHSITRRQSAEGENKRKTEKSIFLAISREKVFVQVWPQSWKSHLRFFSALFTGIVHHLRKRKPPAEKWFLFTNPNYRETSRLVYYFSLLRVGSIAVVTTMWQHYAVIYIAVGLLLTFIVVFRRLRFNKLASLKATLVWNYDDWRTDVGEL